MKNTLLNEDKRLKEIDVLKATAFIFVVAQHTNGTRIYIDVEKNDDKIVISIKNVANYDLGVDEEFYSQASKFGIIIARGIAEIHGGSMKVEREGDLFKVYLTLIG